MTYNASNNCVLMLEAFEGVKLTGYLCPAGVPTISAGLTTSAIRDAGLVIEYRDGSKSPQVFVGKSITQKEHARLFAAVLDHFDNAVADAIKTVRDVKQHEIDALVSLAWNIGIGNFLKSTVLKKYVAGDKAGAAEAFAAWVKATVNGQKVTLKGLVRRRNAEAALFEGDVKQAFSIAAITSGPMVQAVAVPELKKLIGTELPVAGVMSIGSVYTLLQQWQEWKAAAGDIFTDPRFLVAGFVLLCGLYWLQRRAGRLTTEEDTSAAGAVDVSELIDDDQGSLDLNPR